MNIGKVEKLLANSYDKKEYTIFCKIVMFEFWQDYVKARYGEKSKLCYIDTDSFIVYKIRNLRKTNNIYVDITNDVKTKFDT